MRPTHYLEIVVDEANRTERECGEDGHPDVQVR